MKLFHLSRRVHKESIEKHGLQPRSKENPHVKYENKIFLFSNSDNIPFDYVGYSDVDLWEVNLPDDTELIPDKFTNEEGHFCIGVNVPKSKVKLINCFN